MKAKKITILRIATAQDASRIREIAESLELRDDTDTEKTGFLVSAFSQADYERFAETAPAFYVGEIDEKIEGFILAGPGALFGESNGQYSDALFVKQICVSKEHQSTALAQKLVDELLLFTGANTVYADIVQEPQNLKSEKFHRRNQFRPVSHFTAGRYRKSRYCRALNHELLPEQYRAYSNLYQHEDNLTWTKVQRLLILTAALLTVFGATLADLDSYWILAALIAGLGVFVSASFFFSLLNGASYIALRKANMAALELEMSRIGGFRFLDFDDGAVRRHSNDLPFGGLSGDFRTSKMIIFIPILLTVVWLVLLSAVMLLDFMN